MCGVCGIFHFSSHLPAHDQQNLITAMTDLMVRRGPDDDGFWQDGQCSFGFRRLAILDLSLAGHQPMLGHDGRYALVFNGEVYNFVEIRRELELLGIRFRSTSDTEVVLYALAEWGIRALERFNGMFALAFYDSLDKTLILARDHAGIKPMYYMKVQQGVVFASQYNQIIQHPWARGLAISQDALGLYLRFGFCPAPYGIVEQTHLLEAGCWMQFQANGLQTNGRFYEFPRFTSSILSGEKAVDALDDALGSAVLRQLISDVPVGVFLSGGVDSPLVAAYACRENPNPMLAFTIGVSNSGLDESQNARLYADELGLNQVLRQVDQFTALTLLDNVMQACSEPSADFSIFPALLVSQLASEYVKVALSGDGGDELFWGYPSRFATTLRLAKYFGYQQPRRITHIALKKFFNHGAATREILWPNIGRLYQKKHTLFAEEDLVSCFPELPNIPLEFDLFDYQRSDLDETAQWLRWNEFTLHLQRVLLKVDRASMYHSLEVRVPLLDKNVIMVASQVDWRSCLDLRTNQGKIPLRHALARYVKHQTPGKKGFTVPMRDWLMGPLHGLLQEKVLQKPDILGQPLNKLALQRVYKRMLAGDKHTAWGLWLLLSLVLWKETHLKSAF